jgi:hypothetical protein
VNVSVDGSISEAISVAMDAADERKSELGLGANISNVNSYCAQGRAMFSLASKTKGYLENNIHQWQTPVALEQWPNDKYVGHRLATQPTISNTLA